MRNRSSGIERGYLSVLPPFDPETGDIKPLRFERQAEIVLDQMKHCLQAAGSSLQQVLKCNVYCTPDPSHFAVFNEVYARCSGMAALGQRRIPVGDWTKSALPHERALSDRSGMSVWCPPTDSCAAAKSTQFLTERELAGT
jgi:enamine deaminase RidA (YjgF/YER057c/UK114 family)